MANPPSQPRVFPCPPHDHPDVFGIDSVRHGNVEWAFRFVTPTAARPSIRHGFEKGNTGRFLTCPARKDKTVARLYPRPTFFDRGTRRSESPDPYQPTFAFERVLIPRPILNGGGAGFTVSNRLHIFHRRAPVAPAAKNHSGSYASPCGAPTATSSGSYSVRADVSRNRANDAMRSDAMRSWMANGNACRSRHWTT